MRNSNPQAKPQSLEDKRDWLNFVNFWDNNITCFGTIYARKNEIVPFVGAGLSTPPYPLWLNTLKELAQFLRPDAKSEVDSMISTFEKTKVGQPLKGTEEPEDKPLVDPYVVSDLIHDKMRSKRLLHEKLCEIFSDAKVDDASLEKRASYFIPLLSRFCITTNFDRILERTYETLYRKKTTVKNALTDRDLFGYKGLPTDEAMILKLHGNLKDGWKSLIWKGEDVRNHYTKDSNLARHFKSRGSEERLLFLGSSLFHDHFVPLFKHDVHSHFAIIPIHETDTDKQNIEMEKYERKLEEHGGIIPLFFPAYKEDYKNYEWVATILNWLTRGGLSPSAYDIEKIETEIKVLSDSYITHRMHTGACVFENEQINIDKLVDFLRYESDSNFYWWEVCGQMGGGKTRHLQVLSDFAEERDWEVYSFATEAIDNFSSYRDFFAFYPSLKQDTLLIFDEADFYDFPRNIRKLHTDSDHVPKNRIQRFSDKLHSIYEQLITAGHKLRIIFAYSTHPKSDPACRKTDFWWNFLEQPVNTLFAGTYYSSFGPLVRQWNKDEITKSLEWYISNNYNPLGHEFKEMFFIWWNEGGYDVELYVLFVGVMCVDIFAQSVESSEKEMPIKQAIDTAIKRLDSLAKIFPEFSLINPKKDGVMKMMESIYRLGHLPSSSFRRSGRNFGEDTSDGINPKELDDRDKGND